MTESQALNHSAQPRGFGSSKLSVFQVQVVHDLDLKDGKFGRPEAAGLGAMIEGLALRHRDDIKRMEEALIIFDALYARL